MKCERIAMSVVFYQSAPFLGFIRNCRQEWISPRSAKFCRIPVEATGPDLESIHTYSVQRKQVTPSVTICPFEVQLEVKVL